MFHSYFFHQDTTAYPYQFQDDPYLSPRTSVEFVRRNPTQMSLQLSHQSALSVLLAHWVIALPFLRL